MDHATQQLYNIDIERSLVIAAIIDTDQRELVYPALNAEDFGDETAQVIYRAAKSLWTEGAAVDTLSVAERIKVLGLSSTGDDWFMTLVNLTGEAAHSFGVEQAIESVKEYSRKRQLLALFSQAASRVYVAGAASSDIVSLVTSQLHGREVSTGIKTAAEAASIVFGHISEAAEGKTAYTPTGFKAIDDMLHGFLSHEFIVIGGRPGMGKTSLMLCTALRMAEAGIPVAIVSYEQDEAELTKKLVAIKTGFQIGEVISGKRYDGGAMRPFTPEEWQLVVTALQVISDLPISFLELGTVDHIINQTRMLVQRGKAKVLFVDYLQLMVGSPSNRVNAIGEATRQLKMASRSLSIPIVAGSQLSRQLEGRDDKRPMLSDLRESGSIEQDADIVMFVYRDELYDVNTEFKGIAEIVCAKNRRGATGKVDLFFDAKTTGFSDLVKQRIVLND